MRRGFSATVAKPLLAARGARGESPAAFDRRCIPQRLRWASRSAGSHTAGIFPRRALYWPNAASITTSLGATRHFHHGLLAVPALLTALIAAACGGPDRGPHLYAFQGSTMGTTFMVKVVTETLGEERQAEVLELIEAELDEVDTKMSHYLEDSELSRFNRFRDTSPFAVSEETLEVFRHAQEVARLSSGAFDVTVGPLVDAWGFGPEERVIEPIEPTEPTERGPDEVISRLMAQVGYTKIELDLEHSTIRKTDPSVACDLSAIAKGYGVDQVSEALRREGFGDHLVEVGGEVRAAGLNDAGQLWRIAIEQPGSGGTVPGRIVPLSDLAMATSGDYRNYYEVGDVRFSHTIDPRTGYPISHALASVSVVDELSVRADGLTTALAVLGPDEGYELAVEQDLAVALHRARRRGWSP